MRCTAYVGGWAKSDLVADLALHTGQVRGAQGRTSAVGGCCGSSATSRSFMLHSPVHHDGDALLPSVTGSDAAPGFPLPCLRERGRWQACGKCGHSGAQQGMAKVKRPRRRQEYPVRSCAWCTQPVHGDAVTVTFPDKAQVTFHVACLDQYRTVLWPGAAP